MEAEALLLQAMEGCDAKLGPEHALTLVSVKLGAGKMAKGIKGNMLYLYG